MRNASSNIRARSAPIDHEKFRHASTAGVRAMGQSDSPATAEEPDFRQSLLLEPVKEPLA
jgi:hypothetical protein